MLCPFGDGQVVLVNGAIVPGEEKETKEEQDEAFPPAGPSGSASVATDEAAMAPDLDDMAGYEDATNGESINRADQNRKFEAWLTVGDTPESPGKLQHKSTILRFCSNPLTVSVSKDRLKRVCGFSKYNEPMVHSANFTLDAAEDADSMLAVEDPMVTLVRCNGLIFFSCYLTLGHSY
jgi:hypothetical protein